uniref:ATP synthase F0 subunit 8 n=1 Tax=Menida violacea TaxID=763257 RepID=A0A4D6X207_9HEMI|nr:ATP synthase F0 subunit 8 [Menida violacea]YP_010714118.1 ATP synthase F0 subunit 8 [Menida metallica]QCI09894.1 ATP synthase F0 subunit 8 [Menida violacea]QEL51208.1 ATP synthase F0 subunit 8 [Menida violacea]WDD39681.1 ATP synthase F0 subunit 8 [Menida metallica]
MPQMAPLWWEMLFIMFFMSYMIINIMIFFNKNNTFKTSNKINKMSPQPNWLW